MKLVIALVCGLLAGVGHAEGSYHYDPATGLCVDAAGTEGLNAPAPERWFEAETSPDAYEDVDAECADLRGFDFGRYVGLSYKKLRRWNLRGANFETAKVFFMYITDADLSGANLTGVSAGYARITGAVDEHSKLPAFCQVTDGKARCIQ